MQIPTVILTLSYRGSEPLQASSWRWLCLLMFEADAARTINEDNPGPTPARSENSIPVENIELSGGFGLARLTYAASATPVVRNYPIRPVDAARIGYGIMNP